MNYENKIDIEELKYHFDEDQINTLSIGDHHLCVITGCFSRI